MRSLLLTLIPMALLAPRLAQCTPVPAGLQPEQSCTNIAKRRGWHTLSDDQKTGYLDAQLCVLTTPAKTKLPGAITMYDDLIANHQLQTTLIHSTGTFLPYHRFYMHLHETMLRDCGFKGEAIPYWDEIEDQKLDDLGQSAVFDPITGFGGDGVSSDNQCIQDGPFANVTISIGPNYRSEPTCLRRSINRRANPLQRLNATLQAESCMDYDDYESAWVCLYLSPHLLGHAIMGSLRGDAFASPSDPTFFLQHTYLDKLWWDWQEADPDNRRFAMGGPNNQDPETGFIEFPGTMADQARGFGEPSDEQRALMPTGKDGDPGDTVTLDHVLTSFGYLPDATVGDIMDTRGGYLCYEYV